MTLHGTGAIQFLQRAGKNGPHNTLGDYTTSVGGGDYNAVSGQYGTVSGGLSNTAAGAYSVVPGGFANTAAGDYSVALGYGARTEATAHGSFVFGDSTDIYFGTATADQFLVGASGGIRMLSNKDGTTGCHIDAGGGSWACTSSRDVKRDFSPIDTEDVLARALALPVMRWRYMNESPEVRHMGTFSQDFRAAFGLGSDDKSITLIDAEGVALAAIQGLSAKLETENASQSREIGARDARIADLTSRLERIEALLIR